MISVFGDIVTWSPLHIALIFIFNSINYCFFALAFKRLFLPNGIKHTQNAYSHTKHAMFALRRKSVRRRLERKQRLGWNWINVMLFLDGIRNHFISRKYANWILCHRILSVDSKICSMMKVYQFWLTQIFSKWTNDKQLMELVIICDKKV